MSQYVTTNIRIPEEDYLRLKAEAAKARKSLAAIIRAKIAGKGTSSRSPEELITKIRKHAKENHHAVQGGIVTVLREMRNQAKW